MLRPVANPTGAHRAKRRHHGEGTVVRRKDHWRANPWVAVVPYLDASGRRRTMWLSAASREAADELRKRELAKLRRGIVPTHETVGQYVTAWLDTVEVGPGTWPRYRQHVTERIQPSFGDVALDRLTPQMVRSALIGWEASPQTRGGTLRLLRAAMKQAVSDHRIEHDPTTGIPYPKVPPHTPVTLDGPAARHLMDTVKGERFAPILVVSLGLGLRRGEALGLRTQDVNWQANGPGDITGAVAERPSPFHSPQVPRQPSDGPASYATKIPVSVTIAKSLRYISPRMRAPGEGPYRLTGTKTNETRVVPLPAFVAEALRLRLEERDRQKDAAKVWAANDLVFCSPVGNSVPLESLYRWFVDAVERAGLPKMRFHDLRASCVTVLMEEGVDLLTIQRIVGHRDLATTRRYVGKTPRALAAAADKIEEAMG